MALENILKSYRASFPNDQRDDDSLVLYLGDLGRQRGNPVLESDPDFSKRYSDLNVSLRPSYGEEFSRGLSRGTQGLIGTAQSGGALAAHALGLTKARDYLIEAAQSHEKEGEQYTPTIPRIKDIKNASDLGQYLAGGAGEVIPQLGEAAVMSGIGALAGSAVEPGGGTVGGAAAGGVGGLIERQAMRSLLKKGIQAVTPELLKTEGKAIASRYGAGLVNVVNSFGLNAGDIYQDLIENKNIPPETAKNAAILFGAASAVPDTFLPAFIVKKLIPGIKEESEKEFSGYVARLFKDAAKTVPLESLTEGFQELLGIAARKYGDPTDRNKPLNEEDKQRVYHAAALGGLGGLIAAPLAALHSESQPKKPSTEAAGEDALGPINETSSGLQHGPLPEAGEEVAGPTNYNAYDEPAGPINEAAGDAILGPYHHDTAGPEELGPPNYPTGEQFGPPNYLTGEQAGPPNYLTGQQFGPTPKAPGSLVGFSQADIAKRISELVAHGVPMPDAISQVVFERDALIKSTQNAGSQAYLNPAGPPNYLTGEQQGPLLPTPVRMPAFGTPTGTIGDQHGPIISSPEVLGPSNPLTGQQHGPINEVGSDTELGPPAKDSIEGLKLQHEDIQRWITKSKKERAEHEAKREAIMGGVDPALSPDRASQIPVSVTHTFETGEHPLVALMESGKTRFEGSEEESGVQGYEGEAPPAPAYFEVKNPEWSPELERDLISQSSPEKDQNKTTTSRTTFFEDQDPSSDGMVIGLPTYGGTGKGAFVGALPGKKTGMSLKLFLGIKVPKTEEQRWVPLASLRHKAIDSKSPDYRPPLFADAKDFEQRLAQPAKDQLLAARRTAAAVEASMQRQTFGPDGQVVELASDNPQHEDLSSEFFDMMVDYFPHEKGKRTLAPNLSFNDIQNILANAMKDGANQGLIFSQIRELSTLAMQSKEFMGMEFYEQSATFTKALALKIYAAYKATLQSGEAPTPALLAGSLARSFSSPVESDAALAQVKAIAGLSEPGAGFSQGSGQLNAPNGKPTKLTPSQWHQVRTKEFKKWFGDWENDPVNASRVLDENGEPLVVYHGTASEFSQFEKKGSYLPARIGHFFTSSPEAASYFAKRPGESANVLPVLLNLRTPQVQAFSGQGSFADISDTLESNIASGRSDGAVLLNVKDGNQGIPHNVYIARDANQIKSATGNSGEFNASNPDIRFATPSLSYAPTDSAVARHNLTISRLGTAGVDLQIVQARVDGLVDEFFSKPGGAYISGRKAVVLVMSDVRAPNTEDLTMALHETSHYLFDQETPERQAQIHRAIEALNIKAPEGTRIAAGLSPEEAERRLTEEALANEMARQGMDAPTAGSFATRLWRLIKELYYRAAIAIQEGLFGTGHSNPDLAIDYMHNRMARFMAGDHEVPSFLSRLGGGVQSKATRSGYFKPSVGSGWFDEFYNHQTGELEHPRPLFANSEAVRFYTPKTLGEEVPTASADIESEHIAAPSIAAQNAIRIASMTMFNAWESAGLNKAKLTFEQFMANGNFIKLDELPESVIKTINEQLETNGRPTLPPLTRIQDLPGESAKISAANDAYRMLWDLQHKMAARRSMETAQLDPSFPGSLPQKMARRNSRLVTLFDEFRNADWMFRDFRSRTAEMFTDFKADIRDIAKQSKKVGILWQTIRDIEGEITEPIAKRYEAVIDKLFTKMTGEKESFSDLLIAVAKTGYDWENEPTVALRDHLLRDVAPFDPTFKAIMADPSKAKALMGIVIAFAKRDSHAMNLLQLGRLDFGGQLHDAVQALRTSMSATRESAETIVNRFAKAPRLQEIVKRIMAKIESLRAENRADLDSIQRGESFIEFHDVAQPAMEARKIELERMIGAENFAWEATQGASYFVPRSETASVTEMDSKEFDYLAAAKGAPSTVKADILKMTKWLNAVPESQRGARWQTVKNMRDKLGKVDADFQHRTIKRSWSQRFMGSITDKLDATGIAALRNAAGRFRQMEAFREQHRKTAEEMAFHWDRAEMAAKAAVADKIDVETFRSMFYDRALKFIENRPDILLGSDTKEGALLKVLPLVKRYLSADPATRDMINRPGAWDALEKYYRHTAATVSFWNGVRQSAGLKVKEDVGNVTVFREALERAAITAPRTRSQMLELLYEHMLPNWGGTDEKAFKISEASVAQAFTADPSGLQAALAPRFTPQVWTEFVGTMANRAERTVFNAPKQAGGQQALARRNNVVKAYESSSDPIQFAANLYALEGGTTDLAEFVGETIDTFQKFFFSVHKSMQDTADAGDRNRPIPRRYIMDARVSEEWPTEWVNYTTFEKGNDVWMLQDLAYQKAFGRDMSGVQGDFAAGLKQLSEMSIAYKKLINDILAKNIGKSAKWAEDEAKKKLGKDFYTARNAEHDLNLAKEMHGQFEATLNNQQRLSMELKPWLELVHAATTVTLTGPKTALTDTNAIFESPLRKMGVSSIAFRNIKHTTKSFADQVVNTLFSAFRLNIGKDSAYAKRRMEMGYINSDATITLMDRIRSELRRPTAAEYTKPLVKASRVVRAVLQHGAGKNPAYATFKPQSPFVMQSEWASHAIIEGEWKTYEDVVNRAVEKFRDPAWIKELNDPHFTFKAGDLGYTKGLVLDDVRAFESIRGSLQRFGLNLETMARDAVRRQSINKTAPVMDEKAYQLIASLATSEFTGDANITNRPISSYTNPIVAMAAPLLNWSIWKSADLPKMFREPTGEASRAAFFAGMKTFTALLPIGLAYAWLRDEYDEELLGKKSNTLDFSQGNPLTVLVDRMGATGIWGVYGDALNSAVNMSTQRPFTVDSRVFFVSSTLSMMNALGTWMKQDEATYATVYRQLLQSIGGSGYLQYAEILNNALSLDNQEARVTARINATNYLRAGGRSIGMDVQRSAYSSGGDVPSPIKPYVADMQLAALANSLGDFNEARDKAIAAAKASGKNDKEAADYVKRSFEAHHPLRTAFRTVPSEQEYQQVLGTMDARGREDVSRAVDLFNQYGATMGIKPFDGRAEKAAVPTSRGLRSPSLQDIRRSAGMSLGLQ